jgi:hypothetical protein
MRFHKTESGRAEIQQRHEGLSSRARQVLLLCNGQRSCDDLAQMMPADVVQRAIDELRSRGLVEPEQTGHELQETEPAALAPTMMDRLAGPTLTPAQRYQMAVQAATELVGCLGFATRFKAQLSIEKAATLEELADIVQPLFDESAAKRQNLHFRASFDKFRQLVSG